MQHFSDAFILYILFLIIKINDFWGDINPVSTSPTKITPIGECVTVAGQVQREGTMDSLAREADEARQKMEVSLRDAAQIRASADHDIAVLEGRLQDALRAEGMQRVNL